jgi:hypothetical protein
VVPHPEFNESYERARDIRANAAFAEQQLQIADNTADDWLFNRESGKLTVNKEAMLRSKLRIETRQWQMSRRHPQEWGDRQQLDLKHDYSQMSEAERLKKAHELVGLIHEIQRGPELPPPLEYRPEEPEEEPQPSGIGGRLRRL